MNNPVFVSWTRGNGRTTDLAHALGIEPVFIPRQSGSAALSYFHQVRETRRVLRQRQPSAVLLQLPPTPALLCVLSSGFRGRRLVVDTHSGFFTNPKWRWAAAPSLRLVRGSLVLVTNPELASECHGHGVESVLVINDPVEDRADASLIQSQRSVVFCPMSYNNDEPVAEILAAAASTPELMWRLTGDAPGESRLQAPQNVEFTGFVSNGEYIAMLQRAAAVLVLTTNDRTMQRGGYEAMMYGVPLVTSDFDLLRRFHQDSALYTSPQDSRAIVGAVRAAIARGDELRAARKRVLSEHVRQQAKDLGILADSVGLPRTAGIGANKPALRGPVDEGLDA